MGESRISGTLWASVSSEFADYSLGIYLFTFFKYSILQMHSFSEN